MNWSAAGPAVFSLIGVALGTSGSLIGQYLATRTTKAQARADRHAALRAERKEAILAFLETTKQVEHVVEQRSYADKRPDGTTRELTDHMWFLQQCIDLVCSPPVRKATVRYAQRLHDLIYRELPDDRDSIWRLMQETRHPFMDVARAELGIPDLDDPPQMDA